MHVRWSICSTASGEGGRSETLLPLIYKFISNPVTMIDWADESRENASERESIFVKQLRLPESTKYKCPRAAGPEMIAASSTISRRNRLSLENIVQWIKRIMIAGNIFGTQAGVSGGSLRICKKATPALRLLFCSCFLKIKNWRND